MTLCYIIYCIWVIYVCSWAIYMCPCAISNDPVLHHILHLGHICLSWAISNDPVLHRAIFNIVPVSYMFVPVLFKMTLGYIPYGPCVIYVCPSAIGYIPYCPWVIYMFVPVLFKMTQGHIQYCHCVIYMFVPVLFKTAQGCIQYGPCVICLSQCYLEWHRTTFDMIPGSYIFVAGLFQMILC